MEHRVSIVVGQSMKKSDQTIFFGLNFQPVLKGIETLLPETSEALDNNIWVIDSGTINRDHDLSLRVGYSDTQHTRLSTNSTVGDGEHNNITLPAIACVLRPLSGRQNKFVSSRG